MARERACVVKRAEEGLGGEGRGGGGGGGNSLLTCIPWREGFFIFAFIGYLFLLVCFTAFASLFPLCSIVIVVVLFVRLYT